MITFPWRQRWSSSSKAKIGQLGKCRRGLKPSEETKEAKDVIQGVQNRNQLPPQHECDMLQYSRMRRSYYN